MANVKKINGYNLIDSVFTKVETTIDSLTLDEVGVAGTNYADVTLPTGWNAEDTFIAGGYITIYDTSDNVVAIRQINSQFTDITTGEVNFINEVGYYAADPVSLYVDIINYISAWVGYKVVFTMLLYNK